MISEREHFAVTAHCLEAFSRRMWRLMQSAERAQGSPTESAEALAEMKTINSTLRMINLQHTADLVEAIHRRAKNAVETEKKERGNA